MYLHVEPPAEVTLTQYRVTLPYPELATFLLNAELSQSISPDRQPSLRQLKHLKASLYAVRHTAK